MNLSTSDQLPEPPYNFEELRNNSDISNDALISTAFPNRLVLTDPGTGQIIQTLGNLRHANQLDSEAPKELLTEFLFHKIALSFPPVPPHEHPDVQTINTRMSQSALRDFAHQMVNPNDATPFTKHQIIQILDKTNRLIDFAWTKKREQEAIGTHGILRSFAQQEKYFSEHPFLPMDQWRFFVGFSNREIERLMNLHSRGWIDYFVETVTPHPIMILEYNHEHGGSLVEREKPYENRPTLLIPEVEREELQQKTKQTYDVLENSLQQHYEKTYGFEAAKEITQFTFQDVDRSEPLTREILRTIIDSRITHSLEDSVQYLSRNIGFAKDTTEKTSPTQPTALEVVRLAISLLASEDAQRLKQSLPEEMASTLLWSAITGGVSELIGMGLSELNQESTDSAYQELSNDLFPIEQVPREVTDQQVIDQIIHDQKVQIDFYNSEIDQYNAEINYLENYNSSTPPSYTPFFSPDNSLASNLPFYPHNNLTNSGILTTDNPLHIETSVSSNGAYINSLEQLRNQSIAERDQLVVTVGQETTEKKILDQALFESYKNSLQAERNCIIRLNAHANTNNTAILQEQARLLVESQMRSFLIHTISSYVLGFPISLNMMRALYKVGTRLSTYLATHARAEAARPAKKFEEALKTFLDQKATETKAIEQNEATSRRLLEQAQHIETLLEDLEENIFTPFVTVEGNEHALELITKRPQEFSEQEKHALETIAAIKKNLELVKEAHQNEFSQFSNQARGEESDMETLQERVTEIREHLKKVIATIDEPEIANALETFFEYQAAARDSMREMIAKTAEDISRLYQTTLRELQMAVLAKEELSVIPGAPNLGAGMRLRDLTTRYKEGLTEQEHRQAIFSERGDQLLRTYLSHSIDHYGAKSQQAKEDFQKFQAYRRTHLPL